MLEKEVAVAYFLLIMKNILLFVIFFTFHICGQARELFNERFPNCQNNYSFWLSEETPHQAEFYKNINDIVSFVGPGDVSYEVVASQNTTIDDYEIWGDTLFSRLEIKCTRDGKLIKTFEFLNDEEWSRFNYWSFAGYTDNPWYGFDNSICKIVDVGKLSKAIVLRGFRDSIDPESLTIFAVYDNQVKLVFHENMAINKMQTTKDGRTIYELVKVVYPDNTDDILYENYSLCFGEGKITIDRTK